MTSHFLLSRDDSGALSGLTLLLLAICVAVGPATTTQAQDVPPDEQLKNSIDPLIKRHRGEVGLAIRNLKTGEHFEHNADAPMPTASLIKFPLLVTAYHLADAGKIDLDKRISLKESDKVPGSGELNAHFSAGTSLHLTDYLRLMIRHSDNTATNVVAEAVGLAATAKHMESLGLKETKLHSYLYRRGTSIFPKRSSEFGIGSTTANEMVDLLSKLEAGDLANSASTKAIKEHLLACADNTKLAREIPNVTFAHKTGEIANCRTDAGIFYTNAGPIAVCFLTNKNADQAFDDDNPAHLFAGRLGQIVVERFGDGPKSDSNLQEGAFGKLVEAVQRTLNDRLKPSPGLSIDGDFGPATRGAVERFQRANGIPDNGVVGTETWKALGSLIEQDDPVPPPSVINSEKLPVEPQASFSDPPFVTCKAWAIFDANSGELLHEFKSDLPLEAASTTKIMTAYLVCRLAEESPEILDEIITFSERADNTPGSTSALRAGEQVPIRELLYGLLLPSGNDGSVALAEHFGTRLAGSGEQTPEASYDDFINVMNEAVRELNMTGANYTNTHGLSNPKTRHHGERFGDPVPGINEEQALSNDRRHATIRLCCQERPRLRTKRPLEEYKPFARHAWILRSEDGDDFSGGGVPRVCRQTKRRRIDGCDSRFEFKSCSLR